MNGRGAVLLALAAAVGGCSDDFPDYRYRLTVEVETPEGLRTGSSVVEVRTWWEPTLQDKSGARPKSEYSGEAVAVEVAPGQTLFALLHGPYDADYAKHVARLTLQPEPPKPGERGDFEARRLRLIEMTKIEGVHEVPREHWPLFVHFRDPTDPMSVTEVPPAQAWETFGYGVRISRVTLELTDDAVTDHIFERLPWLAQYSERHFDGSSKIAVDPTSPRLSEKLSAYSFTTEWKR